jgi:acetamidase/formamidase
MHHHLDRSVSTSRWNNALPPRITVAPGDSISIETRDASDGQVRYGMSAEAFAAVDKTRIHGLTGPIAVDGAAAGDVLEIEFLDIRHEGWAWTSIIPGLGLLPDQFPDHYIHFWQLEKDHTLSMPGTRIDLAPFAGTVGLQRAEPGEFRTRPPGPWGGNMDVRQLITGSRLFLPIEVAGAGLCIGDCHAAQGDGEVCINGMEAPMRVTVKVNLHKNRLLKGPYAVIPASTIPPRYQSMPWHAFVESDPDPVTAAKQVVTRAISFLMSRTGLTPEQCYILCSVALDLKISQLVNVPMVTVTGCFPEAVFLDHNMGTTIPLA